MSENSERQTKKVLVVDSRTTIVLVKQFVEGTVFDVDGSEIPEEAISILKENPYDIVLFDSTVIEEYGASFIEATTCDPQKTRMVLLSDKIGHSDLNEFFSNGIAGYLIKPFHKDELLYSLERYVQEVTKGDCIV